MLVDRCTLLVKWRRQDDTTAQGGRNGYAGEDEQSGVDPNPLRLHEIWPFLLHPMSVGYLPTFMKAARSGK